MHAIRPRPSVALALAGLLLLPAFAHARRDTGTSDGPWTAAAITAVPDADGHAGEYTVRGAGFRPGVDVTVSLSQYCRRGGGQYSIWAGRADETGRFSFNRVIEECAGTHAFVAIQYPEDAPRIRADRKLTLTESQTPHLPPSVGD